MGIYDKPKTKTTTKYIINFLFFFNKGKKDVPLLLHLSNGTFAYLIWIIIEIQQEN
jgi:predicted ATPase